MSNICWTKLSCANHELSSSSFFCFGSQPSTKKLNMFQKAKSKSTYVMESKFWNDGETFHFKQCKLVFNTFNRKRIIIFCWPILKLIKSSCFGSPTSIERINNVLEGESQFTYSSYWFPSFGLMVEHVGCDNK
jgi:hypothetical protein